MVCGDILWVARDGEDHPHILCGNCIDLDELDEQ